jgi:class 3 adenylate cyclase
MSGDDVARLEKEIRVLRRKLERSDDQRRVLELMNDQNQALLSAVRDQIAEEQRKSESLLLNILPSPIAERLKARPQVIADSFDSVTVVFADLVGFTDLSSTVAPEHLVAMLDEIFTDFDLVADRHGLEKIKTIGDAYMAAAGLPVPSGDHATRAARMALDMLDALTAFNSRSGQSLRVRIGLHTGPVVAGVIGRRKFNYDLWGDTVNTASRMESHGVAGRVQVSDATRALLGDEFLLEERGIIEVKGKGRLRTWFLTTRK